MTLGRGLEWGKRESELNWLKKTEDVESAKGGAEDSERREDGGGCC